MKIVQGAILVMVGALGAMFFAKLRSGSETPAPERMVAVAPPPAPAAAAQDPEPPAAAAEEPAPPPTRHVKKHVPHALIAAAPVPEPVVQPVKATPPPVQPAPEPTPAPAPAPVAATAPQAVEPAPEPAEVAPPPAAAPRQVTLKAGMLVPVRIQDSISSDRYHPGDTFVATLDQPLVVDGLVIAERGARVEGKVVESQRAGRVKGVASIALELTRLNLSDGQHVEISTDSFSKVAPETHGADAAKIGGGAALGAIIGAIAGGGKGAAIGAGVGGAAGTGTVVGTRGKPAVLPSETKISFRLNNEVTVTERRRS